VAVATFIIILNISTVTYTQLKETFVNNKCNLKVRIQGQGDKQTEDNNRDARVCQVQGVKIIAVDLAVQIWLICCI